ncbi:MAG TPA: hypothetical protein VF911_15215 [Thermoanaerobaculia bacterium]|jgi:hypothetical protein
MSSNDQNDSGNSGNVQRANPDNAATDTNLAAQQDQVRANRDALQEQERRVDASVSSETRDTPVQPMGDTNRDNADRQDQMKADHDALQEQARRVDASMPANGEAATDPDAAAMQDRVKADHDQMQEASRRIQASVPAEVRDTPVQPADTSRDDDSRRH